MMNELHFLLYIDYCIFQLFSPMYYVCRVRINVYHGTCMFFLLCIEYELPFSEYIHVLVLLGCVLEYTSMYSETSTMTLQLICSC